MQKRTYFIQDPNTRFALAGASVYVYQNRTTTPITVYDAGSGVALTQPLTADSAGKITFGAPDGIYTVKATGNGATMTVDDQEFFDYANGQAKVTALSSALQLLVGSVTSIGTPGTQDFGVGMCANLPDGFSVMPGSTAPGSDNFGNYRYLDGSVMCWIPAFYYRINNASNPTHGAYAPNDVDVKDYSAFASVAAANAAGYALHRAFYDGGVVKPGFFFDKYACSNNGGIASSIRLGKPLSCISTHNPVAALNNTPANATYGFIDAPKSRGANFHCAMLYQYKALALLSLAHGQAAANDTYCAWFDPADNINFPKGNNSGTYVDVNDPSVTFTPDGYTDSGATSALCGSGTPFAKTTHNGQVCGVADLNGNLYSAAPGLTSDGTNYYVLNTSVAVKSLTSGATAATDVWGAAAIAAQYVNIGPTYPPIDDAQTVLHFGSASQTLSAAVNDGVAGYGWQATGLGMPIASGGTNLFGNDYLFAHRANQLCPIVGMSWSSGSLAGVWALNLNADRGTSSPSIGFRAALYP